VIAVVPAEHGVKPGDLLELEVPPDKLHLFDAETGDALLAAPGA
jgi:hypothetical protein